MNNEELNFKPQKDYSNSLDHHSDSLEMLLHRMTNRIRQSLELPAILAGVTDEVRIFLGTDRVKVYQFEPDGSGEVVAESINQNHLPSLLGQHFPAEDIPPEIRQLYITRRERTIVDVAAQKIGMSSLIDQNQASEQQETIEPEHIRYRPVDPCHVEYLTAMGVKSSLVVPIMDEAHLWGLLVSHHSSVRIVTSRELEVVQLVADQTSIAIAHSNLLESTRIQAQQEASINHVGKFLHSMTQMQLQRALRQVVIASQGSGGRVYVTPQNPGEKGQIYVSGEQPVLLSQNDEVKSASNIPIEEHSDWQKWLRNIVEDHNTVQPWVVASVEDDLFPAKLSDAFKLTSIKSILTIQLEYRQKKLGYLSIFRQGVDIKTIWAKRPNPSDKRNSYPLQAFNTWCEIQLNKAQLWTKNEIELAQVLGSHFAIAIYQYQLYQEVRTLNTSLEQRVQKRTAELEQSNQKLVQEIRDRLKARADLERLSHQNELILNSAGEGIYGLDLAGKITFINPAAAQMLGYDIKELHNQPMYEMVDHSTAEGVAYSWLANPIYQTIQTGKIHYVTNETFSRKDKSNFPVEYVSTPILEKEQIVGAVIIFKDITERQIIDRMKDEFVSVVSHELRTPLTSIRSAVGMLASGRIEAPSAKSQRLLEIAFDNSNRLVRLINDILDLERIKSGKVTMIKSSYDALDIMQDATESLQSIAEKADIKLKVNPVNITLWIDRDHIIQTLTNLLSNAIKFSSPQTTVILDACLQSQDMVRFRVRDYGRGIPSEHLETIFDRFQQVDASDSRDGGGTGLGLAICRSIVQQHGGQIWAESSLGKGSTFSFTLPISNQEFSK